MKKMLLVVDYQNDFVEGSLGFEGAEKLEPGLYEAIQQTLQQEGYLLFTRDTHPQNYLDTREGHFLPVPHCIQHTKGHQLYGRLHQYETSQHPNIAILDKGSFGAANIGQATRQLCDGEPDLVQICGLVTDICVVANAILLHSMLPNAKIEILQHLVDSGNKPNAVAALAVLKGMGIEVVS